MITITDAAGFLHLIPRERLVSISMLAPEPPGVGVNVHGQQIPTGDPPNTKMKLLISFETTTPQLGQLIFFFTDETAIMQIKSNLRAWANGDAANQLVIDAGRPNAPVPETTAAINIG